MNRTSAIRAARTSCTAAQNAGRQDSFEYASKMGINVRKMWVATKDGRTRHEHGMADGQVVGYDEPFIVGGYEMMFPGDPSAPAHLVYNCRCRMRTVEKEGIEAEPRQMRVRDPVTGKNVVVNEMTYSEWAQWKTNVQQQASANIQSQANTSIKKKAVDFDGLENYFSGKYQSTYFAGDIKNLDFKAVNESAEGVDRILDEFPKAKSIFQGFDVTNDAGALMSTSYSGMVYFSSKNYADYQTAANFLVSGETVAGTGMHEAGHLLERALIRANGGSGADWKNCTYAKQVVNEAAKAAKKTSEGKGKGKGWKPLAADVSEYATEDCSECLAECVEYYVLEGNNAPILAKEVWKILKRELS